MKPRKIAVLEAISHLGGAEISLLELVRKLKGDFAFTLILPEDGPLRQKALAAGAEVRILAWPDRLMRLGERACRFSAMTLGRAALAVGAIPGFARGLSALLDEIGADVLLTNGIKSHILGAAATRGSRRPLIWYLRDGLEGRTLSQLALRVCARRCAGGVAISRYVEGEARRVLPAAVPIRVLYNIVDLERFQPNAAPATDLRKAPGEVWFGVVGALTPLKGQDLFLEAAARVTRELPQARFVIVGANFYRTEATLGFEADLRRRAEQPDLSGRVLFLGQREHMPGVLRRLDVLVQPNRGPEGLGRSVLEAMACGVPVIAVDRWGPAELISDGRTGLLTPWLDVPALAKRMLELGANRARCAELGAAGRNWAASELEPKRLVNAFRQFMQERMNGR
ncbi:MAG: glycosyltransferase family 4 protein [Elusimicrobia bacterium]|nr:glycosyltransferase family 4 protein [Elusimicrobiota bacterium]